VREVRIHDTLSGELRPLEPRNGREVGIYACGPTTYARVHVGNARPYVVFLLLKRFLEHEGYDVTLVHNITDINDSIYQAAPNASAELAREATRWYLEDTGALGLGRPDHEPLASDTIPEIVALIEELVSRDLAYPAEGDVYYRVARFPEYGRLSGQRPDQVEEQEPNPLKDDPRDFALWKATKPGEDTRWESPWGLGRPGWHIECSAMAHKLLGPRFEIHGGGLDLVFPHHENELAQSRAVGHEFARIWMHNGMLRFTGEKMSKSVGNTLTIKETVDRWGRETVLLFYLTAHWRKPIDFSPETMAAASAQVEGLRNAFRAAPADGTSTGWESFEAALDDDFNTPEALALMHEWRAAGRLDLLRRGLSLFGLESLAEEAEAPAEITALAEARREARARRDFGAADGLRAKIEAAGWEVRDVAEGFQLVPKP